jgi:hypothetical protein
MGDPWESKRWPLSAFAAVALALIALALAGCGVSSGGGSTGGPVAKDDEDGLSFTEDVFPDAKYWSRPIPKDTAIDPNSAMWVAYLLRRLDQRSPDAPFVNVRRYGVPVWVGGPTDPVARIGKCRDYPCPDAAGARVRVPKGARPDPGSDGHIVLIDADAGLSYELFRAKRSGDKWTGAGGARVDYRDGDGGTGPVEGAVAAHTSLLAGLIRPDEIRRGHIDHALQMTLPGIGTGAPRCPADYSVDTVTDADAPPEGIVYQLDPAFDVESSGLSRIAKIVARALQRYGAVVVDNGGQIAFRAENFVGKSSDPWRKLGVDDDTISLAGLPLDKMRVIASPVCGE